MSKCSGNVRTICGLAAVAAIIVACPACAEDAICNGTPDLSANPKLALGHVTSAANRVHFVREDEAQGCPSRAPVCAKPDYLVPGDRVIISKRHNDFICATYIDAKGVDRSDWLPADAVADDKAEPVALADWLGRWRWVHSIVDNFPDRSEIAVEAGKAGALRIIGRVDNTIQVAKAISFVGAYIKSDVTPAGDRLSFTDHGSDAARHFQLISTHRRGDCKVWMRRLGPWLIVNDDGQCGNGATFRGVYADASQMSHPTLPKDVAAVVDRHLECIHWAGEEPYDKARAREMARATIRLKCDSLDRDEAALLKRYPNDPNVAKALHDLKASENDP
jgi:hypothetical protein